MRAAVYYNNRDVRLTEIPKPEIGTGEILVKVIASGICGSDVMEWYRIRKAPLVLGHEIAGEIAEVGEGVAQYKIGERVFVSHHIPCNTCCYCLRGHHTVCETLHTTNYYPGGFAEYIRIPKLNVDRGVFRLPEDMSFEDAVFIEPLACVIRGQRVANLKPGQSVLILGSGISGLLHLLLARNLGAGRIVTTDVSEFRLETAKQLGADEVIHAQNDVPALFKEINEGKLADLVIVCTGATEALSQSLKCVDRGGTVLFFATSEPGADLTVPINEFWRNEIKLMPSYGNSPLDAMEAIELIRFGRMPVSKLITHRLPLEKAGLGFELFEKGGKAIKVIFKPHDTF